MDTIDALLKEFETGDNPAPPGVAYTGSSEFVAHADHAHPADFMAEREAGGWYSVYLDYTITTVGLGTGTLWSSMFDVRGETFAIDFLHWQITAAAVGEGSNFLVGIYGVAEDGIRPGPLLYDLGEVPTEVAGHLRINLTSDPIALPRGRYYFGIANRISTCTVRAVLLGRTGFPIFTTATPNITTHNASGWIRTGMGNNPASLPDPFLPNGTATGAIPRTCFRVATA